jgi:phosphoenolpyruvate carboxykinase (GTP)
MNLGNAHRQSGEEMTDNLVKHEGLQEWINEVAALTRPDGVVLVDGSDDQRNELTDMLVDRGVLTRLKGEFEGSFYARSDPRDVARVVANTHICSEKDSRPPTNWWDPTEARPEMDRRLSGVMRGRLMYVIPLCMGPIGSPLSRIAVQVTDSPFVVLNTLIMARCGDAVLRQLGTDGDFVQALHSVGLPLSFGQPDVEWPCNPEILKVCHFPEAGEVISVGSGYGGNALLGKKCLALRLASFEAEADSTGRMAEHMMLVRIRNVETGDVWHVAAAFPSACGKTNLAMLQPTIPGYEVTTIGDDIVWMRVGDDGRLYAINPEAGFFGVAPGTGPATNPVAVKAIKKGSILTNVAYNPDTGEAWWPGLEEPPERLITWKGEEWTKDSGDDPEKTVHPNSRFTTPYHQCDTGDVQVWDDPQGVPVDLILFGGRRPDTVPLVRLARDWTEGVLYGAMVSSARTAAAEGKVGEMTHDPFAMGPFFGLSVTDYIANWLRIGELSATHGTDKLPRIGYVNWFQRDANDGHFLWPGFGENARVIDVILRHLRGEVKLTATPVGLLPRPQDFNLESADVSDADMAVLTTVDSEAWLAEVDEVEAYLTGTFDDFPPVLLERLAQMRRDLQRLV